MRTSKKRRKVMSEPTVDREIRIRRSEPIVAQHQSICSAKAIEGWDPVPTRLKASMATKAKPTPRLTTLTTDLESLKRKIKIAVEKGYNGESLTEEEKFLFEYFISCSEPIDEIAKSLIKRKRWRNGRGS